jgi:hypothetical protein
MLHACLCTICFVVCYTSWHFYAFSGTNLLTRCHSASSLFSAVFVFQKSYIENIIGIGQNKAKVPIFPTWDGVQSRDGGGPAGRCTIGWRGLPLARATRLCGHLAHLLTPPFRRYILLSKENLKTWSIFHKTYCKPPLSRHEIGRVQKLFPALYRRGESPPEALFISMPASGVMCE